MKAFSEINRVLVTGGYHIFTIPLHEGRKTVSRAGNARKVYHGDPIRESGSLVITDFGSDLPDILYSRGMRTEVIMAHEFYKPQEITDVDASYEEYLSKRDRMDEYYKYNSVVFVSRKTGLQKKQPLWRRLFHQSANRTIEDRPAPSKRLSEHFLDGVSVQSFSAETDEAVPSGCYAVEGTDGRKFVWASREVRLILKPLPSAKEIHIRGYVNMDIFKAKNIANLTIQVYLNHALSGQVNFSESAEVRISIPIEESAGGSFIQLLLRASDYVCPSLDGSGSDNRRLSWIINEITQK